MNGYDRKLIGNQTFLMILIYSRKKIEYKIDHIIHIFYFFFKVIDE